MTTASQPFNPLVASILSATFQLSRDTSTSLIDSLMEQLADSRAEVDAIRARITALFDGDYEPSSDAVMQALWPNEAQRGLYRQDRGAA